MAEQSSGKAPWIEIEGVKVPGFIYGTAWKGDDTCRLAGMALEAGFRGIDTANQRRHYLEAGVGEALARAFESGLVSRDDIFLQTKFTHIAGQDHRLPYDAEAPMGTQVEQSFASSLEHLGVEAIDSYVLHGPTYRHGLAPGDWEAWRAMEKIHSEGKTRLLGVSNVAVDQLEELHAKAEVKPAMVQNRCYSQLGWDRDIRRFCTEHGMLYQGFSLLTANPHVLHHPGVHEMAHARSATPAQIVFAFARAVGMVPLTGTTSEEHMAQDLAALGLQLAPAEVEAIDHIVV